MYKISLHPKVVRVDLVKIDNSGFVMIQNAIKQKLFSNPLFYSFPLRQDLKGYRKLRVGDYRVVFTIQKLSILIICIGHRSTIYSIASKRI